jgi:hypothetical protein
MSDAAATTRELLDEDSGPCYSLPPATLDFMVYSLRMQAEANLGMLPPSADEQEALDGALTGIRFGFVEAMKRLPGA